MLFAHRSRCGKSLVLKNRYTFDHPMQAGTIWKSQDLLCVFRMGDQCEQCLSSKFDSHCCMSWAWVISVGCVSLYLSRHRQTCLTAVRHTDRQTQARAQTQTHTHANSVWVVCLYLSRHRLVWQQLDTDSQKQARAPTQTQCVFQRAQCEARSGAF